MKFVENTTDIKKIKELKTPLTMDIETMPNFTVIGFQNVETRKFKIFKTKSTFKDSELDEIRELLQTHKIVTFNGTTFDIPLLYSILRLKMDTKEIYDLAMDIITNNLRPYNVRQKVGYTPFCTAHIDVNSLLSGQHSLKFYGLSIHSNKLQEMPVDFTKNLNKKERKIVVEYNKNDLNITTDLYYKVEFGLTVREALMGDVSIYLLSSNDAQVSEKVLAYKLGMKIKPVSYRSHSFTKELRGIFGVKKGKLNVDNIKLPMISNFNEDNMYIYNELKDSFNRPRLAKYFDEGFKYIPPFDFDFKNPIMQEMYLKIINHTFRLNPLTLNVFAPEFMNDKLHVYGKEYQLGVGGLHTNDEAKTHYDMSTADFSSYYPEMILKFGFFDAEHWGEQFPYIYNEEKLMRVNLKRSLETIPSKLRAMEELTFKLSGERVTFDTLRYIKDMPKEVDGKFTTNHKSYIFKNLLLKEAKPALGGLKLIANNLFGKIMTPYSMFYNPRIFLQITLTGQLLLMKLSELIVERGGEIISCNTDGVEFKRNNRELTIAINRFGLRYGLPIEVEDYYSLHQASITSYIAKYFKFKDGKHSKTYLKTKGDYSFPRVGGSRKGDIITKAVHEYIANGTSIEDTIRSGKLGRDFVFTGNAKGGCYFNTPDNFIGKAYRFYYSKTGGVLKTMNGSKIPNSEGCKPLMNLDEFNIGDVDIDKYIELTEERLNDIHYNPEVSKNVENRINKKLERFGRWGRD